MNDNNKTVISETDKQTGKSYIGLFLAFLGGFVSIALFSLIFFFNFVDKGKASLFFVTCGTILLFAFVMAIVGLVIAIKAKGSAKVYKKTTIISLCAGLVALAVSFTPVMFWGGNGRAQEQLPKSVHYAVRYCESQGYDFTVIDLDRYGGGTYYTDAPKVNSGVFALVFGRSDTSYIVDFNVEYKLNVDIDPEIETRYESYNHSEFHFISKDLISFRYTWDDEFESRMFIFHLVPKCSIYLRTECNITQTAHGEYPSSESTSEIIGSSDDVYDGVTAEELRDAYGYTDTPIVEFDDYYDSVYDSIEYPISSSVVPVVFDCDFSYPVRVAISASINGQICNKSDCFKIYYRDNLDDEYPVILPLDPGEYSTSYPRSYSAEFELPSGHHAFYLGFYCWEKHPLSIGVYAYPA